LHAKDFRGVYARHAQGSNVTNNAPIACAGWLTTDGQGDIIEWKDWGLPRQIRWRRRTSSWYRRSGTSMSRHGISENEIRYSVEPDCRVTISTAVPGATGIVTPIIW
jgi:hypothetical protein